MSGYKRVNFYELCRLCATNQQKEKTHIFADEGRKIQLQDKIQSCLSLNVCETDSLPKVVCSKCLRSLEVCYTFRQECVTSESMLSSYYQNFRYTEDFRKSGKVYIKDTTPKPSPEPSSPTSVSSNSITTTIVNNTSFIQPSSLETKPQLNHSGQPMNHIPFYTLQLPTLVTNQPQLEKQLQKQQQELSQSKIMHNPLNAPQVAYNLNTINLAALKTAVQGGPKLAEGMSNVVVNANGEVINIAQLVDFESLINQTQVPKIKNKIKRQREIKSDMDDDDNIIKIDLTESDNTSSTYDTGQPQIKYEKLPHIKSTQNDKYTYTIKVDDSKTANVNPTVIFNTMTNYQQTPSSSGNYLNCTSNNIYPASGINIVTTSGASNSVPVSGICNSVPPMEASTVNLNVLNHGMTENNGHGSSTGYGPRNPQTQQQQPSHIPQSNYTNVISSVSSAPQQTISNNNNNTNANNNNSNSNNVSVAKFSINQNSIPINNVHITATNNVNVNVSSNFATTVVGHDNMEGNTVANNGVGTTMVAGNNQKLHVCEICQKHFKRKEHLYQHIKLHTGFRPYSCENCHKSFMRKEHLLRHMTSHSGQKNFTCNICDKSFSRNDNLLKHKKTHDKQSSYVCEICSKQFVMRHYYMAHKMTHEDDHCKDLCALKA